MKPYPFFNRETAVKMMTVDQDLLNTEAMACVDRAIRGAIKKGYPMVDIVVDDANLPYFNESFRGLGYTLTPQYRYAVGAQAYTVSW